MANTGAVKRDIVIMVLRAHGVDISQQESGPGGMLVLAKDELVEARILPDDVGRRLLQYLQRKFRVPVHHFYNPLMAPSGDDPVN